MEIFFARMKRYFKGVGNLHLAGEPWVAPGLGRPCPKKRKP